MVPSVAITARNSTRPDRPSCFGSVGEVGSTRRINIAGSMCPGCSTLGLSRRVSLVAGGRGPSVVPISMQPEHGGAGGPSRLPIGSTELDSVPGVGVGLAGRKVKSKQRTHTRLLPIGLNGSCTRTGTRRYGGIGVILAIARGAGL